MTTKRETAHAALANVPALHADFHKPILDRLEAAGLLDRPAADGGKVSAASSGKNRIAQVVASAESDPAKRAALRTALSSLRACGVSLDDVCVNENVSLAKLNDALRGQTIGKRMTAKAALSAIGLID